MSEEKKAVRGKLFSVSERDFMFCLAGQLYDQAPNRMPRNADTILAKAKEAFRTSKYSYNSNEYYTVSVPDSERDNFFVGILKSIPEFLDLNLSQEEFEKGIKVDSPDRPKYKFVTRYDVNTSDSWRREFVDLDAFTRNFINQLVCKSLDEGDCFSCINEGNTKLCSKCSRNESLEDNRVHYTKPHYPDYTLSCKGDCPKGRYICCTECKDSEGCFFKCNNNPEECGNVAYKSTDKEVISYVENDSSVGRQIDVSIATILRIFRNKDNVVSLPKKLVGDIPLVGENAKVVCETDDIRVEFLALIKSVNDTGNTYTVTLGPIKNLSYSCTSGDSVVTKLESIEGGNNNEH